MSVLDRGHQWELSGHGPFEQESGDQQPVDFVRALRRSGSRGHPGSCVRQNTPPQNRIHRRSAPSRRRRSLMNSEPHTLRIEHSTAYSSMTLRTGAHVFVLRAELRDGRIHHADRAIGHGFAGENAGCHVGQLFANQAEIRNHLPERLALLGISDRALNAVARRAYTSRAQLETPHVKHIECNMMPFPDLSKHILNRDLGSR